MVLETPSDQLHRVAWIPLFNMLQSYEKYSKPPNISATFFAEKHTLFRLVNNPSLLPDKGMLLHDKDRLLENKDGLLDSKRSVFEKRVEEVDVFS